MEKLPLSEKYMLSINEAGAYFNIGVKKMRRSEHTREAITKD